MDPFFVIKLFILLFKRIVSLVSNRSRVQIELTGILVAPSLFALFLSRGFGLVLSGGVLLARLWLFPPWVVNVCMKFSCVSLDHLF